MSKGNRMDWEKAQRASKGYATEETRKPAGGGQRRPEVKRWEDMTPSERAATLKTLRRPREPK